MVAYRPESAVLMIRRRLTTGQLVVTRENLRARVPLPPFSVTVIAFWVLTATPGGLSPNSTEPLEPTDL